MGASPKEIPKIRCARYENLLKYEYEPITIKIGIDKAKAILFTKNATIINPAAFSRVNVKIELADNLPSTFGLLAVLGFCASISLSKYLLNPMAKFLAVRAAKIPKNSKLQPNQPFAATTIAIKIKGSEKIECLNITSSLKSLSFFNISFMGRILSNNLFERYFIFNCFMSKYQII